MGKSCGPQYIRTYIVDGPMLLWWKSNEDHPCKTLAKERKKDYNNNKNTQIKLGSKSVTKEMMATLWYVHGKLNLYQNTVEENK